MGTRNRTCYAWYSMIKYFCGLGFFIFIHYKSLTDDEYDMFYEMWQKFDPKGSEFIPYSQLSEFVSNLDEPLGIPRPNRFKLISMNLPICQNETVHCSDILGEKKI